MIALRDLSGNVHIVTNETITTVTNMTKEFSRYVFNIEVAYYDNVDEVMRIMKEIGTTHKNNPVFGADILEHLEMLGVDEFADSTVMINFRIKTKHMTQWEVGRKIKRRMKSTFGTRDIEIPFLHRTLFLDLNQHPTPPIQPAVEPRAIPHIER